MGRWVLSENSQIIFDMIEQRVAQIDKVLPAEFIGFVFTEQKFNDKNWQILILPVSPKLPQIIIWGLLIDLPWQKGIEVFYDLWELLLCPKHPFSKIDHLGLKILILHPDWLIHDILTFHPAEERGVFLHLFPQVPIELSIHVLAPGGICRKTHLSRLTLSCPLLLFDLKQFFWLQVISMSPNDLAWMFFRGKIPLCWN